MDSFIETEELITKAKNQGVNFGKSNPYNRLRYYTKIGLLPHMERRKNKAGNIVGHYPAWTINRLILIEQLKEEGLENDDIHKKINELDAKKKTVDALKNPSFRHKVLIYSIIGILSMTLLVELRIIPLGIEKTSLKPSLNNQITQTGLPHTTDAGSYFVPKNENTVFVKYPQAEPLSKIIVTFTQDYSPATKYWIKEIKSGEGFILELDTKVFDDKWFNWYATK